MRSTALLPFSCNTRIPVHATDWTEGNGAWWECGTPEVSPREAVRAARKEHEAGKKKQRVGV